mmetsp:Transcript_23279/g.48191  ORF Transcript_23279/g.48191 Transcript_23279/m.48191 type:complete len:90 (+) Transcript_23279:226-495(+)
MSIRERMILSFATNLSFDAAPFLIVFNFHSFHFRPYVVRGDQCGVWVNARENAVCGNCSSVFNAIYSTMINPKLIAFHRNHLCCQHLFY